MAIVSPNICEIYGPRVRMKVTMASLPFDCRMAPMLKQIAEVTLQ